MGKSYRHGKGKDSARAREARGETRFYKRESAFAKAKTRAERRVAAARKVNEINRAVEPGEVSFNPEKGTEGWQTW